MPWGATDADRAWCKAELGKLRNDGIFTPPSVQGSLFLPGNIGGMAWGGEAYDREHHLLIMPVNNLAAEMRLPASKLLGGSFARAQPGRRLGICAPNRHTVRLGAPVSPESQWAALQRSAVGHAGGGGRRYGGIEMEGATRSVSRRGRATMGLNLLGWADGDRRRPGIHGRDPHSKIRAFNSATGELVWTGKLPSSARATPMTYVGPDGKQYVVIAAGGHGLPLTPLTDTLVAFRLK